MHAYLAVAGSDGLSSTGYTRGAWYRHGRLERMTTFLHLCLAMLAMTFITCRGACGRAGPGQGSEARQTGLVARGMITTEERQKEGVCCGRRVGKRVLCTLPRAKTVLGVSTAKKACRCSTEEPETHP